jgi:two-component system, OmpR family, sensor histidine kinase MprB
MSLRWKIAAALMLLAGLAAATIGASTYRSTRHELNEVIDQSLDNAARASISAGVFQPNGRPDGDGSPIGGPPRQDGPRRRGFDQVLVQVLDAEGNVILAPSAGELPVSEQQRALIAAGGGRSLRQGFELDGESYRSLTVPLGLGAVQFARSTEETTRALAEIRRNTLFAVLVVMGLAAATGLIIGRQVTKRLRRLTSAAGQVASTGRLDIAVPTEGGDETGQLGRAFGGMLAALADSKAQQHQLIQDAGHELRTPLTSLRTNVAVLRRFEQLDAHERERMLADLDSETKELTALVNELVELATEQRDDEPRQVVRLGDVVERAAARTRRRTAREVHVVADDSHVDIRSAAVERAVQNLLDNAVKFAPAGAVDVTVSAGTVTVRDHGRGIPESDLPQIFDRFFRSVESRSQPGSGLGLSIVRSIVESHGGDVFARNAEPAGSGAEIGFSLPTASKPVSD